MLAVAAARLDRPAGCPLFSYLKLKIIFKTLQEHPMTAIQVDEAEPQQAAVVWCCDGCGCVHVRTKSTLLTFTTGEFAAFAESVNECYRRQALTDSFADGGR
ncbi:MAG: hypothetical protein LC747_06365, partial [Acidobacteria bacterium]|nr:hypothetical protein [Acidobacteriota bacterium]